VLLDLGAARRALAGRGHQHTAILKVHYAPIEQYADTEDMQPGPWSDLYSLAAVVYDCLCGQAPTPATFRVIKDRMQPFHEVARVLTTEFGLRYSVPFLDGLGQALEIRPERRPASTRALAECMQLSPADENLSRFDWRAELGDLWLPAAQAGGVQARAEPDVVTQRLPDRVLEGEVAVAMTSQSPVDLTDTVPDLGLAALRRQAGPEPVLDLPIEPVPKAAARQPGAWPQRLGWGLMAVVLVLAGGVGWRWWQTPALAPVQQATEDALGLGPDEAVVSPSPSPVPSGPAEQAAPVAPDLTASSARLAAPSPVPPSVSHPKQGTLAGATPTPARHQRSDPRPAASTAEASPAEAMVDKKPQDGAALCADAGILMRTLCMHRECAKPNNTDTQACVDYRRGMQERARHPDML
jgi:serine/threonine protein kinase